MNYSEMSDFEINKAVADTLFSNISSTIRLTNGDAIQVIYIVGDYPHMTEMLDYCNTPNDAFPIILENKIDVTFVRLLDHTETCRSVDYYCQGIVTDDNPLRAARASKSEKIINQAKRPNHHKKSSYIFHHSPPLITVLQIDCALRLLILK